MINKSFEMDNESLPIKGETRHLFKSETGFMNLLQSSDQGSCSLFKNHYFSSFRAKLLTVCKGSFSNYVNQKLSHSY